MKQKATKNSDIDWFEEPGDDNERRAYRVIERIYQGRSSYQNIEILQLANQGVCLVLDGYARVFEVDEFLYHEALVHPAMHLYNEVEDALLIGDGDGGGIRELLKYSSLISIDWVEIDEQVVNVCLQHLPSFPKNALTDSRLKTYWTDGYKFLQDASKAKYDCIFVSVTEQLDGNVSQPFYTETILNFIKKSLRPGGICIQSAGITSPGMTNKFKDVYRNHTKVFEHVMPYSVGLPSFGLSWGFCFSSDLSYTSWNKRIAANQLKYYDESTHNIMFSLPRFFRDAIDLRK